MFPFGYIGFRVLKDSSQNILNSIVYFFRFSLVIPHAVNTTNSSFDEKRAVFMCQSKLSTTCVH